MGFGVFTVNGDQNTSKAVLASPVLPIMETAWEPHPLVSCSSWNLWHTVKLSVCSWKIKPEKLQSAKLDQVLVVGMLHSSILRVDPVISNFWKTKPAVVSFCLLLTLFTFYISKVPEKMRVNIKCMSAAAKVTALWQWHSKVQTHDGFRVFIISSKRRNKERQG